MGISHPTHPHLGKLSQKTFFFFFGGGAFPYLLKRTLREAAFLRLDVDDMVLMDEERALLGACESESFLGFVVPAVPALGGDLFPSKRSISV